MPDLNPCGHSDEEHEEMHDLVHLVEHVQTIDNPRVAFILTETGMIHFACSVPPHEAADALERMAAKIRRNPMNHAVEHHDRRTSAHLN
jgi:hypothetical protein